MYFLLDSGCSEGPLAVRARGYPSESYMGSDEVERTSLILEVLLFLFCDLGKNCSRAGSVRLMVVCFYGGIEGDLKRPKIWLYKKT